MVNEFDFAIVGAGFFGVRLALLLAGEKYKVVLIERESTICSRASYINQARVHNGYHYPRSYPTALGSHKHYERFLREMHGCIDEDFEHVYAIARHGSYTSSYQFRKFCQELGLPLKPVPRRIRRMFDDDRIEDIFLVREAAFDIRAIRKRMIEEIQRHPEIKLLTETDCLSLDLQGNSAVVHTSRSTISASGVFLVGYAGINPLLRNSGLEPLDLKAEIAEIVLVDVPNDLRRFGVTVMDGPFFSLIPMPAEQAHSFTHVRYTPHVSWNPKFVTDNPYVALDVYRKENRFLYMKKDAQRYIQDLANLEYRGSLFEVKIVPTKHEVDDGRPIVFREHSTQPPCVSILGSKVDSIFELEDAVHSFLEQKMKFGAR